MWKGGLWRRRECENGVLFRKAQCTMVRKTHKGPTLSPLQPVSLLFFSPVLPSPTLTHPISTACPSRLSLSFAQPLRFTALTYLSNGCHSFICRLSRAGAHKKGGLAQREKVRFFLRIRKAIE